MSDNRWTALAAIVSAASALAGERLFGRRGDNTRTPELHERVALLEERLEQLEKKTGFER